jgi:hypothetical protein
MCRILIDHDFDIVKIWLEMAALLVGGRLDPFGIYANPGTQQFRIGHVGGMVLTNLIGSALLILGRLGSALTHIDTVKIPLDGRCGGR